MQPERENLKECRFERIDKKDIIPATPHTTFKIIFPIKYSNKFRISIAEFESNNEKYIRLLWALNRLKLTTTPSEVI